jgi:FtsZ-interacting cell division protein ZipA
MQNQSQNNMITSIDKIPLKTSGAIITDDMADDPIVKDVLNEFEKELSMNEQTIKNNYQINNNSQSPQQYQQSPQQYQQLQQSQQSSQQYQQLPQQSLQTSQQPINYIDNILITKTFIICIVVAIIINPYIYNTIISKIPDNISIILDSYNYIIKIILAFITLYALMFYKLL